MKRTVILLFVLTALFCAKSSSVATDNRVVARVNGEVITASEVAASLPPPKNDTQAWQQSKRQLLDQMINQKLLTAEGRKLGFQDSIEGPLASNKARLVRSELEKYAREQPVSAAAIARESVLVYSNIHLKLMELPTLDTALMVQQLLKNGVPFESLVVRYSRAKVGGPDGDLRWGPLGRTPPEVMNAIKGLKPGESSDLFFRDIYYDFVKYEGERPAPPESINLTREKIVASARRRAAADFIRGIRARVSYDERVLDYLTSNPDSVKPSDAELVVARLPDGSKTRVGSLLPIVKDYGDVFPSVRRKALKEDIENDVLEKEALRLGLDKSPEYQAGLKRMTEQGIYTAYYQHAVTSAIQVSDSEVAAYFLKRTPQSTAQELTPDLEKNIRMQLKSEQGKQRFDALVAELRAKAKITIDEKLLAALKPVPPTQ
jgi:hypothetical protein